MFYKIKDNVFNINEVLYIDNDYQGINIIFNNRSKLIISYEPVKEYNKNIKDYELLCNELINKNTK